MDDHPDEEPEEFDDELLAAGAMDSIPYIWRSYSQLSCSCFRVTVVAIDSYVWIEQWWVSWGWISEKRFACRLDQQG
jgi:hypothetical protein